MCCRFVVISRICPGVVLLEISRQTREMFTSILWLMPSKSGHTGSKSNFCCPCDLEFLHRKRGELVVGGTETKVMSLNGTRTSVSMGFVLVKYVEGGSVAEWSECRT